MTTAGTFSGSDQAPPYNSGDDWYYIYRGEKRGPVSKDEVKRLYGTDEISDETLVWTRTQGSEWVRYSKIFDSVNTDGEAPPIPVTDRWVWWIVAVPFVGFVAEALVNGSGAIQGAALFVPYLIAYATLVAIDGWGIKQSGRKDFTGWATWTSFVVPVYLFLRNQKLNKKQWPLLLWAVSFIATIAIPASQVRAFIGVWSLPECSATISVDQVKLLFPQIPLNVAKLPALGMQNIQTLSRTQTNAQCSAVVSTVNGQTYPITYSIDDRQGEYFYYIQLAF